jgi:hypothetical protein
MGEMRSGAETTCRRLFGAGELRKKDAARLAAFLGMRAGLALLFYLVASFAGFAFMGGLGVKSDYIHITAFGWFVIFAIWHLPMWLLTLLPLFVLTRPDSVISRWYVWLLIGVAVGFIQSAIDVGGVERLFNAQAEDRRVVFGVLVTGTAMFVLALPFRRRRRTVCLAPAATHGPPEEGDSPTNYDY